jgi:hypothetical protein
MCFEIQKTVTLRRQKPELYQERVGNLEKWQYLKNQAALKKSADKRAGGASVLISFFGN